MTYVVEPHSEAALALLQNLAALNLVTLKPQNVNSALTTASPVSKSVNDKRGKRVRRLSPETTQKWLEHLQTVRNEWDRT